MIELCVVGGGRMGEALLAGLINGGGVEHLAVAEVAESRRQALSVRWPGLRVSASVPPTSAGVVAVKPSDAPGAAAGLVAAGATRVLSVAAGVTTAQLSGAGGPGVSVVRAMPNTAALVGRGATAICGDDPDALDWAAEVLAATGLVVRVDESAMDAVTGLSGSGPAYVFLVAEALVEAGVLVGLDRQTATSLAVQTIVGAGHLLAEDPRGAPDLRAAVTSPGGTTAAGLLALERAGVRAAIAEAVVAATARSAELGR